MSDSISRQEAIEQAKELFALGGCYCDQPAIVGMLNALPPTEPELYGYKIEHLALIARVMQKEGITPEKAVQTFIDIKRIVEMLIEEIQEKVEREMMKGEE